MPENQKIRLSPLTRLLMTIDLELDLDERGVLDGKYDQFVRMIEVAERRRDGTLRAVLLFDALAVLFLTGKSVTLPVLGLSLSEIPAAVEVATFLAAVSFLFLAVAQVNWHAYSSIVDQIGKRRVRGTGMDPEFVVAGDKFLEFTVKVYRSKMNLFSDDFFNPERGYRLLSGCVLGLVLLTIISVAVIHLAVAFQSISFTLETYGIAVLPVALAAFVAVANLGAVGIFATLNTPFAFEVVGPAPAGSPLSQRREQ